MKLLKILLLCFFATTLSCENDTDKNFEFGTKYNRVRRDWGVPTIKKNMTPLNCCHEWTVYQINPDSISSNAFHNSKTIRLITGHKVTNEEDIYINKIHGITYQLNLLTVYNGKENKVKIKGSVGILSSNNRQTLNKTYQVDSVLKNWGLSRFDN